MIWEIIQLYKWAIYTVAMLNYRRVDIAEYHV